MNHSASPAWAAPVGQGSTADDADQAVRTEPGVSVAERDDGGPRQLEPAVGIEQQDEVVLRAVALDEGDLGRGAPHGDQGRAVVAATEVRSPRPRRRRPGRPRGRGDQGRRRAAT